MIEIPENVNAFVEQCGDIVAAYRRWRFTYWKTPDLMICGSPIEQLFFMAITTLIDVNNYNEGEEICVRDVCFKYGVSIDQQVEIGKYRVDFCIKYAGNQIVDYNNCKTVSEMQSARKVVVELDGHDFHDKDEKQRRYEKARDRFLQKKGYKVFHYTGSEIVKNPFAAAAECLAFVTDENEDILMQNVRGEYEY